ncbi:MAG: Hsp70 family protein [Phycisphaerales bacterium]
MPASTPTPLQAPLAQPPREPIVGIDLGTTYSLVAIAHWPPGAPASLAAPRIIPDAQGRPLLPSVVRFLDGDEQGAAPGGGTASPVLVGYDAKNHALRHPRTTIHSAKRLMGRSLADAGPDAAFLPYEVVGGEASGDGAAGEVRNEGAGTARVRLPSGRLVSPQEVAAHVLRTLADQASRALGVSVRKAVITVPAYFDDAQRQATRDAARLAGLEAVRIVNEPTAAALAYGLGTRGSAVAAGETEAPKHIIVYDFGGGTFDVSVLRITPATNPDREGGAMNATDRPPVTPLPDGRGSLDASDFFQVLSTAGDTHLGGDDIDRVLHDLFLREMAVQFGMGDAPTLEPQARVALARFAEQTKIRLSAHDHARVSIDLGAPSPAASGGGAASPRAAEGGGAAARVYTRTIARPEFESLIAPLIDRTLAACQRALRDARRELAGAPLDAVVLVGGSTRIPIVRRKVAEFFKVEPYTALDPDQVVALGAAVQASILSGATSNALLLDVIPLSLGVETVGGAVAKLIMRNAAIPARATERFSTSVDNQTSIQLRVLQGEREMAADCRSLGLFHLSGIPPMPAGIPRVVVEFAVDANGVLAVSAVEERSGKRASIQVVPHHGLSRDEVDRLERESFTHAKDDMTRHRVVDLIANSKLDLHWITRQVERLDAALLVGRTSRPPTSLASDASSLPTLPPADRTSLESAMTVLRDLIARAEADWTSVDPNAFHAAKHALDEASIRLHEISIAASLRTDPAP